MAKKLFQNYTFQFNKNERKILTNFCKQALKQMEGNNQYYQDVKAFQSVLDKLNSGDEEIKLTKNEKTRVAHNLKENLKHMKKQVDNSKFIKKWFYKSAYKQYSNLVQEHFSN